MLRVRLINIARRPSGSRRNSSTTTHSEGGRRSLSPTLFLWVRVPIAAITLAEVLSVAIVIAVQSIHYKGIRPYPAHLFIHVLAKVGYVKNATSIVQVRINQVFPEAFEQR